MILICGFLALWTAEYFVPFEHTAKIDWAKQVWSSLYSKLWSHFRWVPFKMPFHFISSNWFFIRSTNSNTANTFGTFIISVTRFYFYIVYLSNNIIYFGEYIPLCGVTRNLIEVIRNIFSISKQIEFN